MNKKIKDLLNGFGLLATVIAMVAGAAALIYLSSFIFHTNPK